LHLPPRPVICDSRCGSAIWDVSETDKWGNNECHSPAQWLGEGFGVAAGWQSVLACELLHRGTHDAAVISAVGCGQQAIGAVIAR
jgi:hypothetical protein